MVPSILAAFSMRAYRENMPGRLYIKTFGCQMNEYDSGKMRDVLETAHGMTRTDDPAEADVCWSTPVPCAKSSRESVLLAG
jgi:tRNA-2-methylthio-N6-dimethylallyladenosine synthase